jgi:hypothetical protein
LFDMLDRDRVLNAFRKALGALAGEMPLADLSPRAAGLRAHEIYCEGLGPGEKRPASETFRKFATGQLPFPEVIELLLKAGIRPVPPARLDRRRLRFVFEQAIQRLEARLVKGQARPRQIVRRAYEIYTSASGGDERRPSHRTFEGLIYGKSADPEILTLVASALSKAHRKDES